MSTNFKFHRPPPSHRIAASEQFPLAYLLLKSAIHEHAFPGCAFGMLIDGKVILQDALGNFTYEQDSLPVTPGTIFDIASLTKVIATTAAAMLLYQQGQLDLDILVGDLLPAFVVGRDDSTAARKVTVRHLLAHSSGLTGYEPLFHQATSPAAVLKACLTLPIEVEPGTRAEYSDPGFILLGKALEALTKEDLATFVHREIFAPLRMEHTGYCPPQSLRHQIPPTEIDELFRQRLIQGEVQDEHAYLLRGVAGHAGLFSNVPDLLRFSAAILNSGTNTDMDTSKTQLFSPDTVEMFAQRQSPATSSRALGWDTPSEPSSSGCRFTVNSMGHLGYSGCSLWIDREAKTSIVLLTNRTWPDRASQLIRSVRPSFHDSLREAFRS